MYLKKGYQNFERLVGNSINKLEFSAKNRRVLTVSKTRSPKWTKKKTEQRKESWKNYSSVFKYVTAVKMIKIYNNEFC